ncbi:hypothetical protein ACFX1X_000026 [Malus domestica]
MKRDGGDNKHGNIDTKGLDKLVQIPQVIDLSDGEDKEQRDGGGSLLISWEARYGIILIPKETYRVSYPWFEEYVLHPNTDILSPKPNPTQILHLFHRV